MVNNSININNTKESLKDRKSVVFSAFGFGRCLWGTDWTRAVELLDYEQGVESFRVTDQLSDSERSELMGGSLAKIYNWSPTKGG